MVATPPLSGYVIFNNIIMGEMLDNRSLDGGDVSSSDETTALASESTETEETSSEETSSEKVETGSEDKNITEDKSGSEDKTSEDVEAPTEKTTDDNSEEEKTEKPLSTRAQRRFQKLIDERNNLAEQVNQQESQAVQTNEQPFTPNEQGEIEMTPDQLSHYISDQVHTTLSQERVSQMEVEKASAWDDDIQELMEASPELDPKSPKFNQNLSNSLVELVQSVNVDDRGNPVVKRLPSEIYKNLQSTLSSAKNDGKKEASAKLAKNAENTAVQDSAIGTQQDEKYTDEQLANLQITDPRRYAELIENNEI